MNTMQRILLAKEEDTYGTDPSPVGTDAINARNIQINYNGELIERDIHKSDFSPIAPVVGKRTVEISFECDLSGSGSAGVAPEVGDLLEACGFTETVNAGSSIVYTPNSASIKSVTFKVYDIIDATDSKVHEINGARGNVSFDFSAGQLAKANFTFKGKYNVPVDDTTVSPTYATTTPPVVSSGSLSFDSNTDLVVQNVAFDMSNEIAEVDDISSANGLESIRIVGRRPSGSINPEAVSVATHDFYTDWVNSTQVALSFNVGSTNYNKIAISAPKVTADALNDGDLNGMRTVDIPIKLNRNSGNDEVSITFA